MNNDQLREVLKEKGITVHSVTKGQLEDLHRRLSDYLEGSGCFRGTFRMNPLKDVMFMTCRSYYFDDREAVSFNSDGFIGFAGWADSKNIKPIIEAVHEWALSICGEYDIK